MKNTRIRSFVYRSGRISPRQQWALETLSSQYLISLDQQLTLPQIFPEGPITLEIGFGMGASLAQMAFDEPHAHFLGVEVHRPGVGSLLAMIESQRLSNLHIICADAVDVLTQFITPDSLDRVCIFFPDPWPKRRHQKRRLIQIEFITLLRSRLKKGGILHMATDWEDYAVHMQNILERTDGFLQLPSEASVRPETRFERRGLKLGYQIVDLVWQRK